MKGAGDVTPSNFRGFCAMNGSIRDFYDNLADSYHLIGVDWDQVMRHQGQVLSSVIVKILRAGGPFRIYDCSCGIGTQAIGLAQEGHSLHASDLSPKAVAQAKSNAARFGVKIDFQTADFRDLSRIAGLYDVVISCDNSLPHLETEAEMLTALRELQSKLEVAGLLLFSIRDYDQILEEKPCGMLPRTIEDQQGKRIYFQTWEWVKDQPIYDVNLFIVQQIDGAWETKSFRTRYRAWRQSELTTLMNEAGFTEIRWLNPEESGYYQPIAVAMKRSDLEHAARKISEGR